MRKERGRLEKREEEEKKTKKVREWGKRIWGRGKGDGT
jgi:hypothetical protein